jgi:hypothetical protein
MKTISKINGTNCLTGSLYFKEINQNKMPTITRAKEINDIVSAIFAVSVEDCFCSIPDESVLACIKMERDAIPFAMPSTTMALTRRMSDAM